MASILKIGQSWRAQIRRKGHKPITETFPTKTAAQAWARKIESEIDHKRYQDGRGLASITLAELITRYKEEMQEERPFGKSKLNVLDNLELKLGSTLMSDLSEERLTKYIKSRRDEGAGGVTINIDLTYLAGVLKAARQLWKLPVSVDPVKEARANMQLKGLSIRSKERKRRPTATEIKRLCDYFDEHSSLPMRDIIQFAIETAMRQDEITRIEWADLNEKDRTVIIRDRKHPTEKQGNDQEVPLLGDAFALVLKQPRTGTRIFPHSSDTISTIFPRACNELKIHDLHFHDFRHEGVSRLFEKGYTIEQVSLVSGHRDWKMLARYTQIRAKDLHRDNHDKKGN